MTLAELFIKLGLKKEGFDQGIDDAKKKATSFGGHMANIGNQIASALGLEGVVQNIKNVTTGIGQFIVSLRGASGGAAIFSGAMKIIKAAMISTGIGALIVALGTLVAYFTQTERGAEQLERALAGVKAVFKVIIDRAAAFGEGIYKIFTGDFKGGWDALKNSLKGIGDEMGREMKQAVDLKRRWQELEDEERNLIVSLEKRRAKAAELRLEARDENIAASKRMQMLKDAAALYNSIFKDEKSIADKKAALNREQLNMTELRDEAEKKQAELEAAAIQKDTERAQTLKALTREIRAVTAALEDENKALSEAEKMNQLPDMKPIIGKVKAGEKQEQIPLHGMMDIKDVLPGTSALLEQTQQFLDNFNQMIEQGMEDAAVTFAEGIGNLITGDMNIGEFGKSILAAIGGFLKQIGAALIAYGLAMDAFKKAFTNPFAAIAAGAALVVIGSVISNMAKTGPSGSGTGGGGSSPSHSASPQAQMALTGNVTFELHGDKLIGVLNNTNRKNSIMR